VAQRSDKKPGMSLRPMLAVTAALSETPVTMACVDGATVPAL